MKKLILILILLTAVIACGAVIKPPLGSKTNDSRVIAAYLFNERTGDRIIDSGVGGNDGTIYPGTRTVNQRAIDSYGPCLSLDGTNDYAEIPDGGEFTFALKPFSISAWINMTDATDFFVVSKFATAAATREWELYTTGADKPAFLIYDETADAFIARFYNTAITSYQDTWIHVAGTYDGLASVSGIKVYINGIQVDDTDSSAGAFVSSRDTAATIEIGKSDSSFANGKIDNIIILKKELSAAEVHKLYREPYCIWR